MVQDDESIQMLKELGLTSLQTKTYLTLVHFGKANVKTIAKASNVARQDIYRVMPTLEKLGLSEKIPSTPTMYKATPIKEGYYLLLQNKSQEHTELQQKTLEIIKNSNESNDKPTLQEETQQFFLISSKDLLLKKCKEEDNKAQTSIDVLGDWESFMSWMYHNLQTYKRALKRGVKIRIITEKTEDNRYQKMLRTLKKNPLFGIRYITGPIPIKAVIFDGKQVSMTARTAYDNEVTPNLWSNNPQFLKVITTYFENTWNKAQD